MVTPLGKHTVRIEADILFLELVGDLALEELNVYVELAAKLKSAHGHFFIIDDMSRFGAAPPEVRKKIAGWIKTSGCLGAAVHGASLMSRTLTLLIVRAVNMLGGHILPLAFFKTEHEARDWVVTQRREHGS